MPNWLYWPIWIVVIALVGGLIFHLYSYSQHAKGPSIVTYDPAPVAPSANSFGGGAWVSRKQH